MDNYLVEDLQEINIFLNSRLLLILQLGTNFKISSFGCKPNWIIWSVYEYTLTVLSRDKILVIFY